MNAQANRINKSECSYVTSMNSWKQKYDAATTDKDRDYYWNKYQSSKAIVQRRERMGIYN